LSTYTLCCTLLLQRDLVELMSTFDTNRNGVIELSEFMEFCMAIPSLPWKAEKARRLSTGTSDDNDSLAEAARNSGRRRSQYKAIALGDKVCF
jgi:hypothetical protein